MKKICLSLIILLIACISIAAQEKLPSYKDIYIGDDLQKVLKIMGKPLQITDINKNQKAFGFTSNDTAIVFTIAKNKVTTFAIIFPDTIPYGELNLKKQGFHSKYNEDGVQYWIKGYLTKEPNLYEIFYSKSGYNGLIEKRLVGIVKE